LESALKAFDLSIAIGYNARDQINQGEVIMSLNLKMCLGIARAAAWEGLRAAVSGSSKSTSELGHNVTTQADLSANEVILNYLLKMMPKIPVLSEETKKDPALNTARIYWVVDPIDGSNNRSRDFPYWSVSISLVKDNKVVVAVVGTMLYGGKAVIYHAIEGGGMFMDNLPVSVSQKKDFERATVAFDNSYTPEETYQVLRRLCCLNPMPWLKNFGSAVLTVAEVAAGVWDAHYHWAFKPWDIASGLLMIQEAGGVIIDLETNQPATLVTTKAICGNREIVNLILSQVPHV
jgi:myo-inositol-1(or 4)-monophosphatase